MGFKPPSHLNLISKRQAADDQMRSRMYKLAATCPLNTLYGVCAFGTKLAFYSLMTGDDFAEISPRVIPHSVRRVNDTVPATRWDHDLLEAEGEARFRAIVQEITNGCAQL